jgi:AcrR family transcriptional regulator
MEKATSKLAAIRQTGKHQVGEQRASMLDAAERLFLQNGLENTKMIDIASAAGITKITLYRYFPNRDVIALEIHKRMLLKIGALVELGENGISLALAKSLAQMMIRGFFELRDAYRYMGMFDTLYLDHTRDTTLTRWAMEQLSDSELVRLAAREGTRIAPQYNRVVMVINTVVWFLEKLAQRGELTWSEPTVTLEEDLKLFEEMILGYFERYIDTP